MEVQMKRGSLDVCVLTALLREDSYGYQIIRDLKNVVEISESTLYPILRRIEKGGYLTTYSLEHNGRLRKMYKITKDGIDKIQDYLEDFQELIKIYQFIEQEMKE